MNSPQEVKMVRTKCLDVERSRKLSKSIRAKNGHCYLNAYSVMQRLTKDEQTRAKYVEGWVPGLIGFFAHAWVELDGVVIDATPIAFERHKLDPEQDVQRHIYRGVLYFSIDELMRTTIPAFLHSLNPRHRETMMKRLSRLVKEFGLLTYCDAAEEGFGFKMIPGTEHMWKSNN